MDKASPVFMDSSAPFGDQFLFTDQFLQYQPQSYGVPIPQASPRLGFSNLNIGTPEFGSYPGAATYTSSAPTTPNQRPFTPIDAISPQITSLSHAHLSGASDNDGFNSSNQGKRSRDHSGRSESPLSGGPTAQPGAGLVHRQPLRRGSTANTTTRSRLAKRRTRDEDLDSDEDIGDGDYAPAGTDSFDGPLKAGGGGGVKRKEDVRRQRIESEQRRRDELREGYRKLKDVLPASNQKSSKVSLLDRATLHIKYLEMTQQQLQARLQAAEMETQRLRLVNEKMMLATAEQNQMAAAAAQASMGHY